MHLIFEHVTFLKYSLTHLSWFHSAFQIQCDPFFSIRLTIFDLTQFLWFNFTHHFWFNFTQFYDLVLLKLHPFEYLFPIRLRFSDLTWLITYDSIWLSYSIWFDINFTHLNQYFQFDSAIPIQFGWAFPFQFDSGLRFDSITTTYIWLIIFDLAHLFWFNVTNYFKSNTTQHFSFNLTQLSHLNWYKLHVFDSLFLIQLSYSD